MFTCKALGFLWTNCLFWNPNWPWQPVFVPTVTPTPLSFMYIYTSAVEKNKSRTVWGELMGCGYGGETKWQEGVKKGADLKVTRCDNWKLLTYTVSWTKGFHHASLHKSCYFCAADADWYNLYFCQFLNTMVNYSLQHNRTCFGLTDKIYEWRRWEWRCVNINIWFMWHFINMSVILTADMI